MSQTVSLILLPQTPWNTNINSGNPYDVVGNSQPAAAYYLGNKDLQTVNIKLNNVTGNIVIQASLATSPNNNDWFKVYELEANTNAPSGSPSKIASNTSMYTNIDGNFVYMRAKVDGFATGIINFVKLNY